MDCSLPGPSIHGIFQARVLEWGAIAVFGIGDGERLKSFGGSDLAALAVELTSERAISQNLEASSPSSLWYMFSMREDMT